jgi:hypothetical protein
VKQLSRLRDKLGEADGREPWVTKVASLFLEEVSYWSSFYQDFGIKIHFEAEEGNSRNVAQYAALDLLGGIYIGKQRSQLFYPKGSRLGYNPRHVFFTWNRQTAMHLEEARNRADFVVVSGFPNDRLFDENAKAGVALRKTIAAKGARFVVALFDNTFGPDAHYSRTMMRSLYAAFLQWVIEDKEMGLLIKSKKPVVIEGLKEIHDILDKAEETGRCIWLRDVLGRLPSEVSQAADISVGIGVSSAVMEAAIAGGRGIHWDPTGMQARLFDSWAYGEVVFDDLEQLMAALRRYKADPASEPALGDHSPVIDELDPFRDGHAGERVGAYIRWLVDAFDAGPDRDSAIGLANEKYATLWGADKIIRLEKGHRTVEAQQKGHGSAASEIARTDISLAAGCERS